MKVTYGHSTLNLASRCLGLDDINSFALNDHVIGNDVLCLYLIIVCNVYVIYDS